MRVHGRERRPTGGGEGGRQADRPRGVVPVLGVTAPWPPPPESNDSVLMQGRRLLVVVLGG